MALIPYVDAGATEKLEAITDKEGLDAALLIDFPERLVMVLNDIR